MAPSFIVSMIYSSFSSHQPSQRTTWRHIRWLFRFHCSERRRKQADSFKCSFLKLKQQQYHQQFTTKATATTTTTTTTKATTSAIAVTTTAMAAAILSTTTDTTATKGLHQRSAEKELYLKDHRLLSLKVPNVKFNFDVSFLTLLLPCKQYIEILH